MDIILLSLIFMAVDMVFLTNLSNRKFPIKGVFKVKIPFVGKDSGKILKISVYITMLILMGVILAVETILIKSPYVMILKNLTMILILYLFSGNFKTIGYYCMSSGLLSFIEVFSLEAIFLPYRYVLLFTLLIKVFLTITVFKELSGIQLPELRTITSKTLVVIFCFIVLCFGMYVNLHWQGVF